MRTLDSRFEPFGPFSNKTYFILQQKQEFAILISKQLTFAVIIFSMAHQIN